MMWWTDGWGGGWWAWLVMSIGMIAFWGVIIWGIVALVRTSESGGRGASMPDPEQILAERFARGEIERDEYERRRAVLRGDPTSV